MQNKTPIVVLTGLGIVAAAAVAGLTRDQWMGHKPEVVASATQPAPATTEPPKTPDQPAPAAQQPAATTAAPTPAPATPPAAQTTTGNASAPAAQTTAAADATTPAQPAAEPPKTDTSQQTASAQPATQEPSTPAADPAAAKPKVPAFDTVRVEKTGEAVIAGTARAGDDVIVKLDGKVIGETTANSDGAFVLVPDNPLPAGSGALTLEAKGKGDAQPTASEQSVAVIVPAADQPQEALVAVVSPDQPTRVLQKPEVKAAATTAAPATASQTAEKPAKLVSIDAVDYDPSGNIVFSGQGNDGNTARVYIDNNFIGDAPVGSDGHWTFSATAQVTPGVHTLRVDGLDSAGKVLNRVEVPFFREQQNKVVASGADATKTPDTTAAGQTSSGTQTAAGTQSATQDQAASGTSQNATTTTPGQAAAPKVGRVVIQPGNNLWRISRVLYGNGAKFTTLYEANKDQIRNPNLIYPGQIFRTPDVSSKAGTVDPHRRDPLKPEENEATGQ